LLLVMSQIVGREHSVAAAGAPQNNPISR
jgi:hypothetical protein